MAGTSSRSPIVLSDDDEPSDPAAQTPPVEGSGDDEQVRRPGWLPDGFDVGVYRTGDGTPYRYYVCAVGGFEFNYEFEMLEYVSSGALGRAVEANATLEDKTTLQGKYEWLRDKPPWVMEIRAGGKNMSKLFKFYAHLDRGVRVASKDDVIRYINESKIAECPYDECDTSCEDNIIAQLQFRIAGLPPGWVKETAFRKCSDGIRKDSFYTDPVNKRVYRSLKNARQYFQSGLDVDSHIPNESVTDLYYFDKCTDMLPCLSKRLKMEGTEEQKREEACQTSRRKMGRASAVVDQPQQKKVKTETERSEDEMATGTSKTPRPRGRPRKS